MLRAQFEGALYFASVYAACVVYSRARSIRRARTIRGNTVYNVTFQLLTSTKHWPLVNGLFYGKYPSITAWAMDRYTVHASYTWADHVCKQEESKKSKK